MSFGSRLKERREALGLKQKQLGELLGVSGNAIGNYENGISSPNANILYKVFTVLKCDANYLYQDEMRELGDTASEDSLANKTVQTENLETLVRRLTPEQACVMVQIVERLLRMNPDAYAAVCQESRDLWGEG